VQLKSFHVVRLGRDGDELLLIVQVVELEVLDLGEALVSELIVALAAETLVGVDLLEALGLSVDGDLD